MNRAKRRSFTWAGFRRESLAAVLLLVSSLSFQTAQADWALARLVDGGVGRVYLARSGEGVAFVREILGAPLRSQNDYDRILARVIRDEIPATAAHRLRANLQSAERRLRDLRYDNPALPQGRLLELLELPGGRIGSAGDFVPACRFDVTLDKNRDFLAEFSNSSVKHYLLAPAGGTAASIPVTRYVPADAQTNAVANQNVQRDLSDYLLHFDPAFARLLAAGRTRGADFHWIDSGGGAGVAMVEAYSGSLWGSRHHDSWQMDAILDQPILRDWFEIRDGAEFYAPAPRAALKDEVIHDFLGTVITYENALGTFEKMTAAELELMHYLSPERIPRLTSHLALARKLRATPGASGFRYLTDRLIQDIPLGKLGKADLITDFFGPYAYAEDKFSILARYARLLKPGGEAHLITQFEATVTSPNFSELPLEAFLLSPESGLADAFFRGQSPSTRHAVRTLVLRPRADTASKLEALSARLRAIQIGVPGDLTPGARVSYPPRFQLRMQ